MIDAVTKQKLLDEISKFGNIYLACLRVGISRANYYRWIKKYKNFKEDAEDAVRIGRENFIDICEGSLIKNVKNGNQRAVEYGLRFNSERYKPESLNINNENCNIIKDIDQRTEEMRNILNEWQNLPDSKKGKMINVGGMSAQDLQNLMDKIEKNF
jgi:hypothetical protein